MRIFRKILFVVLAIAPIMPVILYGAGNIGNTEGLPPIEWGAVTVVDGSFVAEPNTLSDIIITPLIGSSVSSGYMGAVAKLCQVLNNSAGLPISAPVVLSVALMGYAFIVELLDLLLTLLFFIPRKCKEVLG